MGRVWVVFAIALFALAGASFVNGAPFGCIPNSDNTQCEVSGPCDINPALCQPPTCTAQIGRFCSSSAISNSVVVSSERCTAGVCYTCASGYSYDGQSCVPTVPGTTYCFSQPNKACIPQSSSTTSGGIVTAGSCASGLTCVSCPSGTVYDSTSQKCVYSSTVCPREEANPFSCVDTSGQLWKSFESEHNSLRFDLCPQGPGSLSIFQGGYSTTGGYSCGAGGTYWEGHTGAQLPEGIAGGVYECVNNVPFQVTLEATDGSSSVTKNNYGPGGSNGNIPSTSYYGSSTSWKVGLLFTGLQEGKWYRFTNPRAVRYEMASGTSIGARSLASIPAIWEGGWGSIVGSNHYHDPATAPLGRIPTNNFYYCCGAWGVYDAGTAWSSAPQLLAGNTNVCCSANSCVAGTGSGSNVCIPLGQSASGVGGYGADWVCGQPSSTYQPAFYKCDASRNGQLMQGKYCCPQSGGSYAFQSNACGSGAGVKRMAGTDGLTWGTEPGQSQGGGRLIKTDGVTACTGGANPDTTCNFGDGACVPSGAFTKSVSGETQGWLCENLHTLSRWSGSSSDASNVHMLFRCNEDRLGESTVAGGGFVCVQDSSCNYGFESGVKPTLCSSSLPYSRNPDCSHTACVSSNTNIKYTGPSSGFSFTAPRQNSGTHPSASCSTESVGGQCVTLADWENRCYAPGQTGAWDPVQRWLCSDEANGDGKSAWYQCGPTGEGQILEGRCCYQAGSGDYVFDNDGSHPACSASTCTPPCTGGRVCQAGACVCPPADPALCGWRQCGTAVSSCGSVVSCGSCGAGQSCINYLCQSCDADNDGYKPTGASASCPQLPGDCNDNNPLINPGLPESIATNTCTDGLDNDCDARTDYDGFTSGSANPQTVSGDTLCPVSIVDLQVSDVDTVAECAVPVSLTCTASVGNVRSVDVVINGSTDCTDVSPWSGASISFSCPRPSDGSHVVDCYVTPESAPGSPAIQSRTVVVSCLTTLTGTIRDAKTGLPVREVVVTALGSGISATTDSMGMYSLVNVPLGSYDLVATVDGYYEERKNNFTVTGTPDPRTGVDFILSPEQCTENCTFRDVCDYSCIAQGACSIPKLSEKEIAQLTSICTGAQHGSVREFNTTHMVSCCTGGIAPKSDYATPLALKSCASTIVPRSILVNHNGRLHQLTVVTYEKCEG